MLLPGQRIDTIDLLQRGLRQPGFTRQRIDDGPFCIVSCRRGLCLYPYGDSSR
jgi:hypothetical protein